MSFTEDIWRIIKENRSGLLGANPRWKRVSLADIGEVLNGYPFESAKFAKSGGLPLIRIRDIMRGASETCFAGEYPAEYVIKSGDLLVGMDGDFNAAFWTGSDGLLNQRVCKVSVDGRWYDSRFLGYVLPIYLKAVNDHTSAITVKHLSSLTLLQIPLPLPSRREQSRIADRLDELFSDLAAGVAALERVRKKLRRYRSAVLHAAVTGQLTAAWRKTHGPPAETGKQLLARILVERRRQWEERTLAKYAKNGRPPPKNWQSRYVEPAASTTDGLPPLPNAWRWAFNAELTSLITSGSRDWSDFYGRGTGTFIMAGNVRMGWLDRSYRQAVDPPPNDRDRSRSQVQENDLLVTIVGANTGDVCRVAEQLPESYVCQSVAIMRPVIGTCSPWMLVWFISASGAQAQFKEFTYGAGRPHLGFEHLEQTFVALPPLAEQTAIVEAVNEKFSQIDAMEGEVNRGLARAVRLRQAIVKAAFEGKLVPQDPADESAERLLERIRVEHSVAGTSRVPRNRRARAVGSNG